MSKHDKSRPASPPEATDPTATAPAVVTPPKATRARKSTKATATQPATATETPAQAAEPAAVTTHQEVTKEVPAKALPASPVKTAKVKLVRDTFTFPQTDYEQLGLLKKRAIKLGQDTKKSELVRAGLALLSQLDDAALLAALSGVERLKTGRPKQ
jgi:hypothetical protein